MSLIQKFVRVASMVGLVALIGACASAKSMVGHHTVEDLRSMSIWYPERTYEASVEEVKAAAIHSLNETGLENVQEDRMEDGTWYATGEIGYSWRSNGQFVRIAVREEPDSNPPRTNVFYTSLKRFELNVTEDLEVIRDKLIALMDQFIESM